MTRTDRHTADAPREIAAEARRLGLLADETPDYASFLLSTVGQIVTWNIGATRLYGYLAEEVVGQHVSCLSPREDAKQGTPAEELGRAAREARLEADGWRGSCDGARIWARVAAVRV